MIPAHTKAALDRYVEHKILPGGFLMKVLSNDLFGAVGQADSENAAALPEIVKYIYNQLPANAWGSQELVYKFVKDAFYNRVKETV
jgi:hypothetical protein